MKIKKEYIILVLIIIALSVYLYMRKADRTQYQIPKLPEIVKNDISKFEITRSGESTILSKKDGHWFIAPQQYPADETQVKSMLDTITDLTLTALVSESKNYIRYELSDENKINVRAWQGEALKRNFDIGKPAASMRHTFVKIDGDDRVYHARNNFRSKFEKNTDDLRDKTILSFTATDVQEISVTGDQLSLNFMRTQATADDKAPENQETEGASSPAAKTIWQSSDGKPADPDAINQLLAVLSKLRCDNFIDDKKKEDFTAPIYAVGLRGTREHDLLIYAKLNEDDGFYPATSSASDYPFNLSAAVAERIMKNPAEMLRKEEKEQQKSS